MKARAATLLIKVKAHRGCPLNEEDDIRAEMGRMKQEQEKTWSTPTSRTIYQWSETSKNKSVVNTTKQTGWTQTVRNRMRQKAGEIQAYRTYEKGSEKWRKDHMPRKGKGISLQKGKNFWKTKKSGEMKLSFTEPYTNPENGKDPTKTGCSCHTKKDQSHLHSLSTGFSGRDRDESCWENG